MDTATQIASITDRNTIEITNGTKATGRRCVSITRTGTGLDVTFGWWERNGWNGSMEFVVSPRNGGRVFATARGAARSVRAWFARDACAPS